MGRWGKIKLSTLPVSEDEPAIRERNRRDTQERGRISDRADADRARIPAARAPDRSQRPSSAGGEDQASLCRELQAPAGRRVCAAAGQHVRWWAADAAARCGPAGGGIRCVLPGPAVRRQRERRDRRQEGAEDVAGSHHRSGGRAGVPGIGAAGSGEELALLDGRKKKMGEAGRVVRPSAIPSHFAWVGRFRVWRFSLPSSPCRGVPRGQERGCPCAGGRALRPPAGRSAGAGVCRPAQRMPPALRRN